MAAILPDFPSFDINLEPTALGVHWKKWIQRLENLFLAMHVNDTKRQKALLLHYGGSDLSDIRYTLQSEDDIEFKHVKVKLDAYFEPKVNVTFETYTFRQLSQDEDESIDKFVTRLREAAGRCNFHDKDREIKDQIVQKCHSDRLRRKALREDPTLDNLIAAARAMEMADCQAKTMEDANVMRVRTKSKSVSAVSELCVNKVSQRGKAKTKKDINKFKSTEKTCFSCGGAWPHPARRSCPAFGVECHSCGGKNHYAKLCKIGKDMHKSCNRVRS